MTLHAVVLGAGGFIGSHLSRRLVDEGWRVTGVVRDPHADDVTRRLGDTLRRIRLVAGDATNPALLSQLVVDADAVFPLAGRSGAARSMETVEADLDANGRAQLLLLEAVRRFQPEARLVFPGSRLQYGACPRLPVTEDEPQLPTSLYGIHKLLGEQYHRLYHRAYGLPTTSLRISIPYGPHQERPDATYGIVGTFLAQAARGEAIHVYGGGHQLRDYIYIDDLTSLLVLAATHPAAVGEVFNASGSSATSLRVMAETVVRVVGSGEVVDAEWPAAEAAVETGHYVGSCAKAVSLLGWHPTVDLEQGIARTWAQLRTTQLVETT